MFLPGPQARYAAPAAPRNGATPAPRAASRQRRFTETPTHRALAAGAISPVLGEARPRPTPPLRQLASLQREQSATSLQSVDSSRSRHIAAIASEAAERGPCDGAGVRSQLRSRWPNLEMEQKDVDALNQLYGDYHGILSGSLPAADCPFSWPDPFRQAPTQPEEFLKEFDAPFSFSDCRADWDHRDDSQYRLWLEERTRGGTGARGGSTTCSGTRSGTRGGTRSIARSGKENGGGSQSERLHRRSASTENIFNVNGVGKDALKLPARRPLDRCNSALALGMRQPPQPCGEAEGWSSSRSVPLYSPKSLRKVPMSNSARLSQPQHVA